MLSFSTSWNSHRQTDGEILLSEVRSLGFDCVELGEGLKLSLAPGIRRMVQRQRARVTSVANFCPAPIELQGESPEQYEFSSAKKAFRQRAVRLTMQTIDCAREFEAEFVIVKLGKSSLQGVSKTLFDFVHKGNLNSRDFVKVKIEAIRQREAFTAELLPRVKECLDQVLDYAAKKEVKIAIQSGSDYEDAPTERELLQLLQDYQDNPYLGYWHDFGHAQRKENLGILDHPQWLKTISPRLFGCHLHDVHWPDEEYRVPLSGMIDFERLMPLIPKDVPMVWELSSKCKSTDIKQALPAWVERFEAH